MNELKDRKPFHEKLQQYKAREQQNQPLPVAVDLDQVLRVDNHHKTADEILNFDGNVQVDIAVDDAEDEEEEELDADQEQE